MKKVIKTQIEINASAETIWTLLTNFSDYQQWNPFIKKISGTLKNGEKLEVHIFPPNGNKMVFKPTLLEVKHCQSIRWLGTLGIKGIFDGQHEFIIEKVNENKCIFHHNEYFSGILIPFFGQLLIKTERGFTRMNEALKIQAEQLQKKLS